MQIKPYLFSIGTDPSLTVEDLEKMKGEITFGSNRNDQTVQIEILSPFERYLHF